MHKIFSHIVVFVFVLFSTYVAVSQVCTTPDAYRYGTFSVKDCGAYGDNGVHDDYAGIQAALDYLCATPQPPTLVFPNGIYKFSKVPRIRCGGFKVEGGGKNTTLLRPMYQGPVILDIGSTTPVPLTAGLTSSGGNAMVLNGTQQYQLNLNDAINVSRNGTTNTLLDGLTQFSIETFVNIVLNDANARFIASSQGDPFSHDTSGQQIPAFELYTQSGNIICTLNVSGARKAVSYPINAGITHFVSCDWDGTTEQLYIDGTLGASTPASGVITQAIFQTVTVGNPARFMESGSFNFMASAIVDSMRISDVVQHTSGYTPPTAKLPATSSTVALLNFDNQSHCDICTVIHTKHGDVVTWLRYIVAPNSNGFQTWSDIWFDGPLVIGGTAQSSWRDVVFHGYPYDVYAWSNNFISTFYNANFLSSNRSCTFSLGISGGGSGDITMTNSNFGGCGIGVADGGDSSLTINGGSMATYSPTRYGFLLQAAGPADQFNITGMNFSQEGAVDANFVTTFGIAQPGLQLNLYGGTIESFTSAPVFLVDGVTSANIAGVQIKGFSGNTSPSVFKFLGSPQNPLNLFGTIQTNGTTIPWSNKPGTVAIVVTQVQ